MSERPDRAVAIRAEGVYKSFREGGRDRSVLVNLDARVEAGQMTAIIGRSGTGKSTLLNLVSGIDLPDAGEVTVAGVCLNALSERDRTLFRRHEIGFVFQFFNLVPTLSVEQNLLLPLELIGEGREAARHRVRTLLDAVRLGDRADSFPDRLSGGEQQRVAIARALVHRPTIVLADEPTGNLDAETGREVLDLLAALTRDSANTLVVVTHSGETAALADERFELDHGGLRRLDGAPALARHSTQ